MERVKATLIIAAAVGQTDALWVDEWSLAMPHTMYSAGVLLSGL